MKNSSLSPAPDFVNGGHLDREDDYLEKLLLCKLQRAYERVLIREHAHQIVCWSESMLIRDCPHKRVCLSESMLISECADQRVCSSESILIREHANYVAQSEPFRCGWIKKMYDHEFWSPSSIVHIYNFDFKYNFNLTYVKRVGKRLQLRLIFQVISL